MIVELEAAASASELRGKGLCGRGRGGWSSSGRLCCATSSVEKARSQKLQKRKTTYLCFFIFLKKKEITFYIYIFHLNKFYNFLNLI